MSLLEVGRDALIARIHLIRSARTNIEIQTMIWANDETGRFVMYELIQAARRGVEVRLLIDHLASEQGIEIAEFLAYVHPNLKIKLYNPVSGIFGSTKAEPSLLDKLKSIVFDFKGFNQRMHNKTFIVDDLIGITGGRNYQNAYYDQARGMNYKDRDILVTGPVVKEMTDSFDRYWDFKRSIRLMDLADVKKYHRKGPNNNWHSRDSFRLNGLFGDVDTAANRSELISQQLIDSLVEVNHAYFIADNPQKMENSLWNASNKSKITLELAGLVSQAKQSVYIQTPYLVLTSSAISLFKDLRKQYPRIDIRISTNSLAATDSWYVYALSYKQKQTYLNSLKFKIYEFKPVPYDLDVFMPSYEQLKSRPLTPTEHQALRKKTAVHFIEEGGYSKQEQWVPSPEDGEPYFCLHAKSLVVDEKTAFVGSYNLDPRSENLNTECGLIIRDKKLAQLLQDGIKRDMRSRNSWVIAPKKRPSLIKETNAVLVKLSHLLPLVDIWPFRYAASFELIDGKPEVESDHVDFYKNYRDVGSFPQVISDSPGKEIGARGTKAFLSVVKPLL